MCYIIFLLDDYIAIGADCDELGAQIEEYILFIHSSQKVVIVIEMWAKSKKY